MNDTYRAEWNEAIRLLHKFCPVSKSQFHSRRDFNLDTVLTIMRIVGLDINTRKDYDQSLDSVSLLKKHFDSHIHLEKGRALLICDAGDAPIICSAEKLYERVSEGIKRRIQGEEILCQPIDGGDTLFVFETTGKMLFFDHSRGVSLAIPRYK